MNERFSSRLVSASGKSHVAKLRALQTYDIPAVLLPLLPCLLCYLFVSMYLYWNIIMHPVNVGQNNRKYLLVIGWAG